MNKVCVLFFFSLSLLISCHEVETDPVGRSDFILINDTSMPLYFESELEGEFTQSQTIRGMIASKAELVLFYSLSGIIASHPRAEDVFRSVLISTMEDYSDTVLYQNPVSNSQWDQEIPEGYAAWEYTRYFLSLTD